MSTTMTWLGNAAYRLDTSGLGPIYIDPWIDGNPSCPITLDEITDASVVLVSHGHPGHFGNSVFIAARTGATYVTNEAVADYVRNARLLPADQVVGLKPGASYQIGPVAISIHPISHPPQDVVSYAPAEPNTASVLRLDDISLFHAGDIGMDPGMAEIGASQRPTHAIVPLTGSDIGLSAERALAAALALGASTIIPTCRFSSYAEKARAFEGLAREASAPFSILEPELGGRQGLV